MSSTIELNKLIVSKRSYITKTMFTQPVRLSFLKEPKQPISSLPFKFQIPHLKFNRVFQSVAETRKVLQLNVIIN